MSSKVTITLPHPDVRFASIKLETEQETAAAADNEAQALYEEATKPGGLVEKVFGSGPMQAAVDDELAAAAAALQGEAPTQTAEAPTASADGAASTTSTPGAADTSSAPSADKPTPTLTPEQKAKLMGVDVADVKQAVVEVAGAVVAAETPLTEEEAVAALKEELGAVEVAEEEAPAPADDPLAAAAARVLKGGAV